MKKCQLFSGLTRIVGVISLSFALVAACPFVGARQARAAAKGTPIKIGLLAPLTGVYAEQGREIERGLRLALEEVEYKVAGREIRVITGDTEAKPATGLTKAKKLVESDKVHLTAGIFASSVALAVRDYIHEQKVPHIILAGAVALALSYEKKSDYLWRASTSAGQWILGFPEWLYKEKNQRKMVVFVPDYAYGHDVLRMLKKGFESVGGRIVQEMVVPFPTLDFAPYLARIDTTADGVYAEFAGADAIRFVKQYKDYKMWEKLPLYGGSLVMQEMLPAEGDAALGIIGSSHYTAEIDSPENKVFLEAYRNKYGTLATAMADNSYEGTKVIIEALKKIDGRIEDKASFLDAVSKVDFKSPRGRFRFELETHSVIHHNYITRVEKRGNHYVLSVIGTTPEFKASDVKKLLGP